MADNRLVAAVGTGAVLVLCALLVVYGVSLLSPGIEYAGSTVSVSFGSDGVTGTPLTTNYVTYQPTFWGFAPMAFAFTIGFATLLRAWPVAFTALAIMTVFSFLTGFSIGGPMAFVALLMWPALALIYGVKRAGTGFEPSMKARWDRLTK